MEIKEIITSLLQKKDVIILVKPEKGEYFEKVELSDCIVITIFARPNIWSDVVIREMLSKLLTFKNVSFMFKKTIVMEFLNSSKLFNLWS